MDHQLTANRTKVDDFVLLPACRELSTSFLSIDANAICRENF